MAHKFDPENVHRLLDPGRLDLFDPRKILRDFGLREGMSVLDVGTGPGFYLPYLSEIVGSGGRVYAVDIQEEMLRVARETVSRYRLENVSLLKSEENTLPLPGNTIDFAFIAFTFHELTDPLAFLRELRRVCREQAYVAVVDWKKEERDKGPPPEEVLADWEVALILEEAGFRVGRVIEIGRYCFGIYASLSRLSEAP